MENKEEIVDVKSVVEVSAEDGDAPIYQVESLCMRCGENVSFLNSSYSKPYFFLILTFFLPLRMCFNLDQGVTRFLLTLIPHFRKVWNVIICVYS